jgi:3-phosphoglycerate kinase
MTKKTVKDVDVKEKKVLVRCDFNVPLKEGTVADDTRIRETLPTIEYLMEHRAAVVLCSHLGRPKAKPDAKLSLRPVAQRLTELLNVSVGILEDCIGDEVESAVTALKPGEVLLLENTRFHEGEKSNDPDFAAKLAKAKDKLILPEDVVIARQIREKAEHKTVSVNEVPSGWKIVDIGPASVDLFINKLKDIKTVIWNGPLGVFETVPFDGGTKAVARGLAGLDAEVYVGGGDSGAAVHQADVAHKMTHVSTGGGAFLEFLEGRSLPCLTVLQDK